MTNIPKIVEAMLGSVKLLRLTCGYRHSNLILLRIGPKGLFVRPTTGCRCHMKKLLNWRIHIMVLAFLVVTGDGGLVRAATFTVTNTNDSGPGSLRQAIADANSSDTITFDSGILPGTITLTTGRLNINKDLTIQGPGASDLAIDGNNASRVFTICCDIAVTITGLTIQNGFTGGNGGGIANLAILAITNSTISGNSSRMGGGGIYNVGGTLTITDSTISNNSVNNSGGGGGIRNIGSGTVTIANSTITGNAAAIHGGGIENGSASPTQTQLIITNSTITGNSAAVGGGVRNLGTAKLTNTIIANSPSGSDCSGEVITSLGHNLDSDRTCGLGVAGDISGVNPLLGPLADNGGTTFTRALLPGSPATDAGDNTACPDSDQRGVTRPQGSVCDIGAYEHEHKLTAAELAAIELAKPVFLIIAGETINNGTNAIQAISFNDPFCGGGDPSVCVNDDIAEPGLRTLLFTRGSNDVTPYNGLKLPTGEAGKEGLYRFSKSDPQVSLQNGATFTIAEFIAATGAAGNVDNLDKIDGVVPLSETGVLGLQGRTVCAVVYDSDLRVDIAEGFASLGGATLGLTSFEVTAVTKHPAGGLDSLTVNLLPSNDVQKICNDIDS